uniref:Centromere protein H C-terminal domain-containing protein n=1 Tax=Denticeps clupeoides TaxID=299321 RepID=A0AAY4DSY7_9TELE
MEGPTPGAIPDGVTTTDLIRSENSRHLPAFSAKCELRFRRQVFFLCVFSRMKDGMSNQCFEMAVKLATGTSHGVACTQSESYFKTIEMLVQLFYINNLFAFGSEMRTLSNRNADLCSRIRKLQQESHDLQDQITKMQIKRRETKGHIKEKMLELTELKQMRENKGEVHQHIVDRAESVLEKYQKIATISQNVLRGIILASRVNWIDDPKLRGIAMGLENIPK